MRENQLRQDLTLAIEQAISDPAAADIKDLLSRVEQALLHLPEEKQLRVAGIILAQLVEIYVARAERLLDLWEEKYNPIQGEPILTADMLQEVLRHTMTLNLDAVMEGIDRQQLPSSPSDSIIGNVDKTNLLEFLNQMDQESTMQKALNLAHDEDIPAWIGAISNWMQTNQIQSISLLELQRSLQMPLMKIWLALLLGGFVLEQRGDFYQIEGVWVTCGSR